MNEFEILERESKQLTARVEEFLRHISTTNAKALTYLSRLHVDPLPEFESE
jgi:hypothetical protein